MKNRLQALSLLDRALLAMTDAELEALVATLPDDHREAIDKLAGARDEAGFEDPAARTVAIRATVARGRMSGALEQVATVLTDPCLADCIEQLGDSSDNPSEADLAEVTPGLIERHGLATVRLTLAASVAGEAAASVLLTRLLKHDEVLALPAREAEPVVTTVNVAEADDETKARRKAAKERKQVESRLRREQQARARNRV
ncbi:MAG: hypothetical protein JWN99_1287 [Ilumatobacteraceae bacterium]|nr:hypothetical protein [Ilumatobacteraceae bacterium]